MVLEVYLLKYEGTGLIIGTGQTLAKAGLYETCFFLASLTIDSPGSLLIAYLFVGEQRQQLTQSQLTYQTIGVIVSLVMFALGEMATWLPLGEGFPGYASRFCDPALGFALGWTYFFKYLIVTPNQLTAAALVLQYWVPSTKINPGVFITIALLIIVSINYFGVRMFGEFEFWLSSFKILVLMGLLILSLILSCGGGPDHAHRDSNTGRILVLSKVTPAVRNPLYGRRAFTDLMSVDNQNLAKFVAFWSTMVTAVFVRN